MYTREIILIEDNPSDVELTKRAFKKARISNPLRVFDNGQSAIDYLSDYVSSEKRKGDTPLLVLLDVNLPVMSGLEVLRFIKSNAHLKKVLVVMLTTSSENRDLEQAYELGANSYIIKLVDFEKFSDLVAQIGMYWMVINEPPRIITDDV
ncbi:MAG: response regulator [Flavobacteriales bacterium]|jgi:two-component system response regulator